MILRCLTLFPSKLFAFLPRAPFLQRRLSSGTASLSPASSTYWVQLPVNVVREVQARAPAHAQPFSSPDNISALGHLPPKHRQSYDSGQSHLVVTQYFLGFFHCSSPLTI